MILAKNCWCALRHLFSLFFLFGSGRQTVADSGLENKRHTMRTPLLYLSLISVCRLYAPIYTSAWFSAHSFSLLFFTGSRQAVWLSPSSFFFPPFSYVNPPKVSPQHLPMGGSFFLTGPGDSHVCCCSAFFSSGARKNNRETIHQF
jgi:heme A synthase